MNNKILLKIYKIIFKHWTAKTTTTLKLQLTFNQTRLQMHKAVTSMSWCDQSEHNSAQKPLDNKTQTSNKPSREAPH